MKFYKKNSFFLISFLGFIVLHKLFEALITKLFVKDLLSYVQSAWYNDIIFGFIVLYIVGYLLAKFKRYVPSRNILLVLVLVCIIYIYYRISGTPWNFTSFAIYSHAKYADCLVILTLSNVILHSFRQGNKPNNDHKNSLFADIPINEIKSDELGYSSYAKYLSQKIKNSCFEKSFAIGINGRWGQGKSSFINLVQQYLADENIIHIQFNPWNSNNPNAIIEDFFDSIREKLRPFHASLAGLLLTYSNKLVSLNENRLTKSVRTSAVLISGYDSLNNMFSDINSALKDLSKKLVIYIDDLDRLDKDEIIEVIRLIRNTGNFYNTFFIVAYDRSYVINALEKHNPYNHEEFLEKIFQIEITMPYFQKEILIKKLDEKLKESMPLQYHEQIEKALFNTSMIDEPYLHNWLDTIRDVTRLANAVSLNLSQLLGEVEINDFIKIEILRLKYPSVYELLFRKRETFLQVTKSNNLSDYKYHLIYGRDRKDIIDEKEKNEKYLKIYIQRNRSQLGVPESEIDKIVHHIDNIFPDTLSYSYYDKNLLSIVFPSKFDRYFAYNLLEGSLSEIKFSKGRSLKSSEFNTLIDDWISKGLANEVSNRFYEIKAYDNKEDFEKVIKAIFHLANHENKTNQNFNIIGYDSKDLQEKLADYRNLIAETYYANSGGKEGLRNFIKEMLMNATSPYTFEADFVRYVVDKSFDEESFPLTKEELKSISLNYFNKYCENSDKIDNTTFRLFWSTQTTDYIPTGGSSYRAQRYVPEEAKTIMKKHLLKDFDEFLLRIIEIEPFHQKSFTVSKEFIFSVYGSWEEFLQVLNTQNENRWKYLNEFKNFFDLGLKDGFGHYVPFEFKTIPVSTKIRNNNLN